MKNLFSNRVLRLLPLLMLQLQFGICQLSGFGLGMGGAFSNFEYGDQINTVDDFDNDSKSGGTAGIRFDFDLGTDILKLSPEVFIVQNGAKEYYKDIGVAASDLVKRKVSMDYIGLYLPLTIFIPMSDNQDTYNGLLIQGRLFADYAIKGQISDEIAGYTDIHFKSMTDKFDYGYSLEAGFVAQSLKFTLGYNWGLKNIEFTNALGDINTGNYLIKNKGLTLQIGCLFRM